MKAEAQHEVPVREPDFLLKWEGAGDRGRATRAGVLSLLVHVAGVIVLLTTPFGQMVIPQAAKVLKSIPLIAPPEELTQKAPNRGPISKEFDLASLMRQRQTPAPVAPSPPKMQTPMPPMPAPSRSAPPQDIKPNPVPEPPRMDAARNMAPPLPPMAGAPTAPVAVPQIQQQEEKPKLAFESVGAQGGRGFSPQAPGDAKLRLPGQTLEETIRGAMRSGAGGISVGDDGESGLGSLGGLVVPPSQGRAGSSLELLSDPEGVDFHPYLQRVLILVRRNWRVVYPESARLGARGKVIVQFLVTRDGRIPKLVLATESGTRALDLAAVAAIQTSIPLPQLPPGFKSDRVRLQLSFLYNIK